jgi:hypothetical protein
MVANWLSRNIDHDEAERRVGGAAAVGQRPAGERHGHRQFGQRQHPRQVEEADDQRGDEHGDRAVVLQAEVPAEVFAGDDDAHAQRPDVQHAQRLLEGVLPQVGALLGPQLVGADLPLDDHLGDDGVEVRGRRLVWFVAHDRPQETQHRGTEDTEKTKA